MLNHKRLEDFIFSNFDKLRVDILIWDMDDSRHKNSGRDDNENLSRMYYHLIQNTLSKGWDKGSTWLLVPDHQSSINWRTLGEHLVSKKHKKKLSFRKTGGFKTNDPRENINFWLYTPQHSKDKAPIK